VVRRKRHEVHRSGCVALIVCATIVRDAKVLLVKHSCERKPDCGDWLLPAGRAETGESLEEALKRELKEELGLTVKIVRKLTQHIDPYTKDKLVNFLCTPLTLKTRISWELAEARWFSLDEVKRMREIHPGLKEFLITGLDSHFLYGYR